MPDFSLVELPGNRFVHKKIAGKQASLLQRLYGTGLTKVENPVQSRRELRIQILILSGNPVFTVVMDLRG